MADKILLDGSKFVFSEEDLPCLVTYRQMAGGSRFTVALAANLFLQGSKLLLFTAKPMAKDEFYRQISGENAGVAFVADRQELQGAEKHRVVILESGDESLFAAAVESLSDIDDRVVIVKNIDVFTQETVGRALAGNKTILSGDIDKCPLKESINNRPFKTIIAFSRPSTDLLIRAPEVGQWKGYLTSGSREGIVSIEKSDQAEKKKISETGSSRENIGE